MWKSISCEVQGLGHIRNGVPCQDKALCLENNGVNVIVLADGAGSARLSHFGAECVVETVSSFLSNNFKELFDHNDSAEVKTKILEDVKVKLYEKSNALGCTISDLASTLLFVAVSDNRYILGHIGDGVIGYLDGITLKVASFPNNGEFANETIFITSNNAIDFFGLFKGNVRGIIGFVIMSDGTGNSLYHKKTGSLSRAIVRLIGRTFTCEKQQMESQLTATFENVIRQKTQDDCSIAIMSRSNIGYDLINGMSYIEKYDLFKITTRPKDSITRRKIKWYSKILRCIDVESKSVDEISQEIGAKKQRTQRTINALLNSGLIQENKGKYSVIGY